MGNERVSFESGKVFHIYNHGNANDLIFREDQNYGFFLKKYQKYISSIADTYAYCLLPNHFHLMVKIKSEDELKEFFQKKKNKNSQGLDLNKNNLSHLISHQFGTLFNSYTKAFNNYYDRRGSLFENTFKRKPVTKDRYYNQLIRYIHINPVKHGFVDDPAKWPYSSYHSFLSNKPTLLEREEILEWFGGREEFIEIHKYERKP